MKRSGQIIGVVAEVVQPDGSTAGAVGGADGKVGDGVSGGGGRTGKVKVFSLPFEDGGVGRVAVAGRKSGAGVPRRHSNRARRHIDGIDCSLSRVFRPAQIFFDYYFVAQIKSGGGGRQARSGGGEGKVVIGAVRD